MAKMHEKLLENQKAVPAFDCSVAITYNSSLATPEEPIQLMLQAGTRELMVNLSKAEAQALERSLRMASGGVVRG